MTAAFHALILIFFYFLISGLGYPGLVVFQQQNIFLIRNMQLEPYTSSKQQERHNKHTVLKSLEDFLVAEGQTVSAYRQQPHAVHPVRRDQSYISKKGERIWTPRDRTPT